MPATTYQDIITFVNAEPEAFRHDLPVASPAVNSNQEEDPSVDNLPVLDESQVKILLDCFDRNNESYGLAEKESYGLAMSDTEEKRLLNESFIYGGVEQPLVNAEPVLTVASAVSSDEDPSHDAWSVDELLDNITVDSCHESECTDNKKKSNYPTEEEVYLVCNAVDVTNKTPVVVPEDIHPGKSFNKNVGGWNMKITCPENPWPNAEIFVTLPTETDVLKCEAKMGKNKKVENHPGNILLKELVEENYEDYTKIPARAQKTEFYRSIAQMVDSRYHSRYWKQEEGAWVQMTTVKEIHEFIASKFKNITKKKKRAEKRNVEALFAPFKRRKTK